MGKLMPGEHALPHAGDRTSWTYMDPVREGLEPRLVYRVPVEEAWNAADWLMGDDGKEASDEKSGPPTKKRGLSERLKRLVPLLLHEFGDNIDGFDDKEIRYGDERAIGLLPKIRLKRRKRPGHEVRGRALASYPWLKRLFPQLISYDEEEEYRKFVFRGWRPASIHILGRVLTTKEFRFRLEDLSHFATHGDYVLRALEHVDPQSNCLDPDAILYVPAIDPGFPFKFAVCALSRADNYVTFVGTLKRIFEQTEGVEAFRDRFYSECALGFEKFGPACATPEFQEVELRLWTLLDFASTRLQINVAELVFTMDGPKIRKHLASIRELHEALDDCAKLPHELAAFYRTRFDIPFGKLFEHALLGIDEIAKRIGCDPKARPRDIGTLTEMITRFRKLEPADPLENLEKLDAAIVAAYAGKAPEVASGHPSWVRRYSDVIFTGTDKYDPRRYKKPK